MKPVRADFRDKVLPRRLWWLVGGLVLASASGGGIAWREWRRVDVQSSALRDALRRKDSAAVPRAAARVPVAYEASAREMLIERAMPWPQALTAIEATTIVGVTPLAVEFAANDKTLRLEVTFSDYGKLLEYVEALNAGEPELRWSLAQSQAQTAGTFTATLVANATLR